MLTRPLSATVLICTYNRADRLREMLESLQPTRTVRSWDVVVVDNNSSDDTREVVEAMAPAYPVPLFYIFEPRQGKSHALNTGIEQSRGEILVFTDDDVIVEPTWVDASCEPLDEQDEIDYSGGPVRPIWGAPPPAWLDQSRGDLWGTLAILDYGATPFVFETRMRVPLGANMAVRRRLIERIGGFHPELGRRGKSLLGQEQAEFFARARHAGARGIYSPVMAVQHHVPVARLTKQYFRRWWYWKGVARARVDAMHQRTELGLDLRTVPYLARAPRFVWGLLVRALMNWTRAALAGHTLEAAREQMRAAFAAGYLRACWSRDRRKAALATRQAHRESASFSR